MERYPGKILRDMPSTKEMESSPLNPDEAEKVYSALMSISDMLGLDKYAKDGGMSYTVRELDIARRIAARRELPEAN